MSAGAPTHLPSRRTVIAAEPLAPGLGSRGLRPAREVPPVRPTSAPLTLADHWDHWAARWGYRRNGHRVEPGLYALGAPTAQSPVLVTANYTLSFDALRSALPGHDAYLLVLDTQGINVWCAAGKGTFGTAELVERIERTGLAQIVDHRRLILPQLGAPGVAAHDVRRLTGFRVEYGPVRAADLPAYLAAGTATPAMRRVTFTLRERLVLIPVELVHTLQPMAIAAVVLYALAGWVGVWAVLAAVLAGTTLFPLLLPWLPGRAFSVKGLLLGALAGLPVALAALNGAAPIAERIILAAALWLGVVATTAYLALNFTGATPITSKTGVQREMLRYLRPMAIMGASGFLGTLGTAIVRWMGE